MVGGPVGADRREQLSRPLSCLCGVFGNSAGWFLNVVPGCVEFLDDSLDLALALVLRKQEAQAMQVAASTWPRAMPSASLCVPCLSVSLGNGPRSFWYPSNGAAQHAFQLAWGMRVLIEKHVGSPGP